MSVAIAPVAYAIPSDALRRLGPDRWAVASASEPGAEYLVVVQDRRPICECVGWSYRHRCRHAELVAAQLAQEPPMSVTALTPVRASDVAARPASPLPASDQWTMMVNMARTLKASGVLPRHIGTPEAAVAIILQGYELGIGAMQSLNSIYLIEGHLTIAASLMGALIYRDLGPGAYRVVESSDRRCIIEARRAGWPEPSRMTWTIEMATAAGLAGKDNWKKFPQAMLLARCTAAMARAYFPEIIRGCYAPEELGAPVRVTPEGELEVIEAELRPPAAEPVATPPPARTAPARSASAASPVLSPTEPATDRRAISDRLNAFWSAVRGAGWNDPATVHAIARDLLGRPVDKLTSDEIDGLEEHLLAGQIAYDAEGKAYVRQPADEPGEEGGEEPPATS